MKYCILIPMVFCTIACLKGNVDSPASSSSDGYGGYYQTTAKVIGVGSCDEEAVMLDFTTGGWSSLFTFPYGFNGQNVFWSFDLPDSLKAPGQELEISFSPITDTHWKRCANTTYPNQVKLKYVKPVLDWTVMEVTAIPSACGKPIIEIDPSYKYRYGSHVIVVNMPNILNVTGRIFGGYFRYASVSEQIKCDSNKSLKQVVVTQFNY